MNGTVVIVDPTALARIRARLSRAAYETAQTLLELSTPIVPYDPAHKPGDGPHLAETGMVVPDDDNIGAQIVWTKAYAHKHYVNSEGVTFQGNGQDRWAGRTAETQTAAVTGAFVHHARTGL